MSKFQHKIRRLVEEKREFRTVIGGVQHRVIAVRLDDDHVVLEDQDHPHRYDMHFSQVVILSSTP